ncbi:MAG: 16S rRNA (guanine(966)-N(2))-methyltransferase RsmD [Gammaproteobacteria bacterium]
MPAGIRIIGGRWRGTRIEVADRRSLRPSADRVRETLFNWLAPVIDGAHCLDLFAGTGVLGFEAVSRGAASATLIEQDGALILALRRLAERLAADNVTVHRAEAQAWLATAPRPYDIVFVDPPFAAGLETRVLERLGGGWLAPHALVYLEQARDAPDPSAPWSVRKCGRTRHVSYKLLERVASEATIS